jgi:hypothetical protein
MQAWFAVNLRADTLEPDFRRKLRPWGYLAPPAEMTPRLNEAARGLRRSGRGLVVDNGLFDDISRIGKALAEDTKSLTAELKRLGRDVSRATLPAVVRAIVDTLAARVVTASAAVTGLPLTDQLALAPNAVVGAEDVVGAAWLRVGLDAPLLDGARRDLARRNRAVAKAAARIAADVGRRAPGVRYHGVASALDYDSARDAGRAFAAAGLRAAAMGFGAYMRDGQYAREMRIGGRRVALPRLVPMRYLRCALAARGFWDGWRDAKEEAPAAFHFLGLGAPIMMGIVALAAARTRILTFDATSPIQDAVEGTLYWAAPTYLKVRTRRAARHLATGRWDRWRCPCPFCRDFVRRHPFDYRAGHDWAAAHPGDTEASAGDLKPGGALYAAYPLLSEPAAKDPLRNPVTQARSGHNHWMLQRILADLRRHGRTPASLERHVRQVVETYARATTDQYEQAARIALDVVTGVKYVS